MAHDDQFTAVGPSLVGSGFPRAAFSTKAADMVYGANVVGEKCGVYGESALSFASDREVEVSGIGVCGIGENFGVLGRSNRGAGVVGRTNRGRAGIIGAAMREGTGVVGASLSAIGNPLAPVPDPGTGPGIGVFGTSGEGPGVRGSSKTGDGGQFASQSGVGVRGDSTDNRGGIFSSGPTMAQIRLAPLQQDILSPILPKNGKVGDLVVIRHTAQDEGGRLIDRCSLWLCTPKDPGAEDSDQWQQVLLGATVTGTL